MTYPKLYGVKNFKLKYLFWKLCILKAYERHKYLCCYVIINVTWDLSCTMIMIKHYINAAHYLERIKEWMTDFKLNYFSFFLYNYHLWLKEFLYQRKRTCLISIDVFLHHDRCINWISLIASWNNFSMSSFDYSVWLRIRS